MLAYKPKEEPVLTKIVKSGMFQFLMVVLLGIGVTYFVVRTDQPQQWIQKINRFASVSPNPKAVTEAGIAEDQAEFEAPPPEANTWAARSASPTGMTVATTTDGATPAAPVPTTDPSTANSMQTTSAPVKLRVQMGEIDINYLNNITSERRNGYVLGTNGNIVTFRAFPDFKFDSTHFKILKTDSMDFTTAKNQSVTAGNNIHWIRFTVSVLNIDAAASKFFDAVFIKNHPSDPQQIPVDLTLIAGEKYIIYGSDLLAYFDTEASLTNTAPFTVFKSADYRNQKTTFAIIVELQ